MLGVWCFFGEKHRLEQFNLLAHIIVNKRCHEWIIHAMGMQETSQIRESHGCLQTMVGPHKIEHIDHRTHFGHCRWLQERRCLRCGRSRHLAGHERDERLDMLDRLFGRTRMAEQCRIREYHLHIAILYERVHEWHERAFVLRIINEYDRVWCWEDPLNLRLRFGREEDSCLAGEIPRTKEKQYCSEGHGYLMRCDETRQSRCIGDKDTLLGSIDHTAEKEHEGWHDGECANKRAHDTFGQDNAHICTYLQAHEA